MRHNQALELLGFEFTDKPSKERILVAFYNAVRSAHPDKGGLGDIGLLKEAKDILLKNSVEDLPCPQCAGRGSVIGRIGVTQCGRCGGAGTLH